MEEGTRAEARMGSVTGPRTGLGDRLFFWRDEDVGSECSCTIILD